MLHISGKENMQYHYRLLTLVFCQTGILNKSTLDHSHCDITI